jgi:hypothetical protein
MDIIPLIAGWLHIDPASLLLYLGALVTIANVVARLIPNDATGALGVIRKVAAVIGVYVSSRVTSGTSVNDVAAATIATSAPIAAAAAEPGASKVTS